MRYNIRKVVHTEKPAYIVFQPIKKHVTFYQFSLPIEFIALEAYQTEFNKKGNLATY